jgi:hypothetical protein
MKFMVEIPDRVMDKMLGHYLTHFGEGNYADALKDVIVTSGAGDYFGLLYADVDVMEL